MNVALTTEGCNCLLRSIVNKSMKYEYNKFVLFPPPQFGGYLDTKNGP